MIFVFMLFGFLSCLAFGDLIIENSFGPSHEIVRKTEREVTREVLEAVVST